MQRLFIHLQIFDKKWKNENLSDDLLKEFQEELNLNPKKGDIIPGTSGIRKIRCSIPGKGKSGDIRVFYIDIEEVNKIYL